VYKRDRLGRPDISTDMMSIELAIRRKGVTIVFSDGIAEPIGGDGIDLANEIAMLLDYRESGQFLKNLAERILLAQRYLAERGFRTGGSPPYGFARFLVDECTGEVEELEKGRVVKKPGCHVTIMPKDEEKLRIWLLILDLILKDWGCKRIAAHLNRLGVPSPGVGTKRTDHGVEHYVSGKWNASTVIDLCRNEAITGFQYYGKRSEGKHRRLGENGHRHLDDCDQPQGKHPRVVLNKEEVQIRTQLAFPGLVGLDKWLKVQKILDDRGKNQRGIPR
jgi:hypothetical protein